MTVTVYKSTDASAPTLTGQVGSLVALLDAILVNGYGSKASQGWTKPYTATNKAVFKMAGGNQRYIDVDDTNSGSGANISRIVGYETMTAVATGTGPFPSAALLTGGVYVHKSSTADATARPWYAIGNGTMFYLLTMASATSFTTNGSVAGGFMFGDFTSYTPGDTFNTILCGAQSTTLAPGSTTNHLLALGYLGSLVNGAYVPRAYTGIGGAVEVQKRTNYAIARNSGTAADRYGMGNTLGVSGIPLGFATGPNIPDGGFYLDRIWLSESAGLRGELPGLWTNVIPGGVNHLDTIAGNGPLTGKTFEMLVFGSGGTASLPLFEISNTW